MMYRAQKPGVVRLALPTVGGHVWTVIMHVSAGSAIVSHI